MSRTLKVQGQGLVMAGCLAVLAMLAGALAVEAGPAGQSKVGAQGDPSTQPLVPVGTGFTYSGRLTTGGSPANGAHDFTFKLYDALSIGSQVGTTVSVTTVLTEGLFTVVLDFGPDAFQGEARWLEGAVRPAGVGAYTTLSPRQALSATPYASGLVPGAIITGSLATPLLSVSNIIGNGLYSLSGGSNAYGIRGEANNGSLASGVYGQSSSGRGVWGTGYYGVYGSGVYGVYGQSSSGYGVYGLSTATNGKGVYGVANNGSFASGVYGESSSGKGVWGTGYYGVYGESSSGKGVYGLSTAINGGEGVYGYSAGTDGSGVRGRANDGNNASGVYGESSSGKGVWGSSTATHGQGVWGEANYGSNASGVYGTSSTGHGVSGYSTVTNGGEGVSGYSAGTDGSGVRGRANNGNNASGVYGTSSTGHGVRGSSTGTFGRGVWGEADNGTYAVGVYGTSSTGRGVSGYSTATNGTGVHGIANTGSAAYGVYGESSSGYGVFGTTMANNNSGVRGEAHNGIGVSGVFGLSTSGSGVSGLSTSGSGVFGSSSSGNAGYFLGNVVVTGSCCAAGASTSKIDHPLDPENKYLSQALVESPDMMNIYNGNISTDAKGDAVVVLPAYVEALNRDFRYQLTVIGQFADAIVLSKIKGNRFTVKTDKPNVEVSWLLIGIRKDPYAKAHPLVVEEEKKAEERGKYRHPREWGQPESKGVDYEKNKAVDERGGAAKEGGRP